MKNTKKFLALALASVMAVSVAACEAAAPLTTHLQQTAVLLLKQQIPLHPPMDITWQSAWHLSR